MMPSRFNRTVRLPLWGAILGLALVGVFSKRGLSDWRRIAKRSDELRGKIQTLKAQKVALDQELRALRSDPTEQERVIRQTLGYLKPGELLIEFP